MTFLENMTMTKLVWIQKGKNTNTWQAQLRKQQEYSIIILKTEKKHQEDRALELKVQHNSKLNKNKPKLQIPHDMNPIAKKR